jgi:hypothetical protein
VVEGGPIDPSAPNIIHWIKRHQTHDKDQRTLCFFFGFWLVEAFWLWEPKQLKQIGPKVQSHRRETKTSVSPFLKPSFAWEFFLKALILES